MVRNRQKSIISKRVQALMQVLFGVFLFLYFYFLQSPLLELAQHQLSEGKTVYHPTISAFVLAVILVIVQHLIGKWIHFKAGLYCISYLPSVVLGLLLTSFTPQIHLITIICCSVLLLIFVVGIFINAKLGHDVFHEELSFTQHFVRHSVGLICILSLMGIFSNSNDVTTYEIQTAHYIREGLYEKALIVGQKSLMTSDRLTALRALALSHSPNGLGNSFFTYPIPTSGAEQLLFSPADTLAQVLSPDSLYITLGGWKSEHEDPTDFFLRVVKKTGTSVAKDYRLIALMLDKNLTQFTTELSAYYPNKDSVTLPRFYQEALVIYAISNSTPINFLGDSLCFKDFDAYKLYGKSYANLIERKNQLRRKYGDTYWWFYDYQE